MDKKLAEAYAQWTEAVRAAVAQIKPEHEPYERRAILMGSF